MTALTRLLFPVPALRRSPVTILGWWESRRITYNAIVGGAGIITVTAVQLIGMLPPHPRLDFPWIAVVAYGIFANICYTFGFALEALLDRIWGDEVAPVGPTLFRHGLVFSVGLTLLPIGIAWIGYLVSVLKAVL
jgi:hypothetical protein